MNGKEVKRRLGRDREEGVGKKADTSTPMESSFRDDSSMRVSDKNERRSERSSNAILEFGLAVTVVVSVRVLLLFLCIIS